MGGRRPRPCLRHLPRPDLGPRLPTGHPAQAHRRAGRLPALDLRQPALGREPLGATERVAGDRNPLRKNRQVLPRRPLLRRHLRLAQGLTGLRVPDVFMIRSNGRNPRTIITTAVITTAKVMVFSPGPSWP